MNRLKQRGRNYRLIGIAATAIVLVIIGAFLVPSWWKVMVGQDRSSAPPATAARTDPNWDKTTSPHANVATKSDGYQSGLEPEENTGADAALDRRRATILQSSYGKAPISDVLHALSEVPGGPDLQILFQVLAMRKEEALPLVKAGLVSGTPFEKHMLTKLLRMCPWPETKLELLALAGQRGEDWLARQGALYALGSLGDASVGAEIAGLLRQTDCPKGVKLIAIATMARIGYREGVADIQPFTEDQDIHTRLFASRAVAEFGQDVNYKFLISALQNSNYLVRQEACEALGALQGADTTAKLRFLAENDPHEAVRDAAVQALLQREIRGLTPSKKLLVLKRNLQSAERRNALWIVQTILAQCGSEGRSFVETLAMADTPLGERSAAFLLFSSSNTQRQ